MTSLARILALLATLIFTAQSVAATGMAPGGMVVILCSPDGTRTVTLDANGDPVETSHTTCLKCYIAALALPPNPQTIPYRAPIRTPRDTQTITLRTSDPIFAFAPRAPPQT